AVPGTEIQDAPRNARLQNVCQQVLVALSANAPLGRVRIVCGDLRQAAVVLRGRGAVALALADRAVLAREGFRRRRAFGGEEAPDAAAVIVVAIARGAVLKPLVAVDVGSALGTRKSGDPHTVRQTLTSSSAQSRNDRPTREARATRRRRLRGAAAGRRCRGDDRRRPACTAAAPADRASGATRGRNPLRRTGARSFRACSSTSTPCRLR